MERKPLLHVGENVASHFSVYGDEAWQLFDGVAEMLLAAYFKKQRDRFRGDRGLASVSILQKRANLFYNLVEVVSHGGGNVSASLLDKTQCKTKWVQVTRLISRQSR